MSVSQRDLSLFVERIPKAELHVHIEGTLEPELLFKLASRNKIKLKYENISDLRKAYNFTNLQSFLNVYYEGAKVLLEEEDFYDLTIAYLRKAFSQKVLHVEIFFDPQTHLLRGVSFNKIINGIWSALQVAKKEFGISAYLIMCFLRDLSTDSAVNALQESLTHRDKIIGIGLDSAELGNPPSKFCEVFKKARSYDYLTVAHAGEEGPVEYIWDAINLLDVLRIDHGIKCLDDRKLVRELVERKIPLTVCPLSNVRLGVFKRIKDHNIKKLIDNNLLVTINSDDPPYFGGYINENFLAVQKAFKLTKDDIHKLAKNSFEASFLNKKEKEKFISYLNGFMLKYDTEIKAI